MIQAEGVYELPMEEYQADPCPSPSLSSGAAHRLITQSPLHAWFSHPRLNPRFKREEAKEFDLGSCAHALLLDGEKNIVAINYPDWRKKEAQQQRAEARSMGKIPVLSHKLDECRAMADVARQALKSLRDPIVPFHEGHAERVLFWREGGLWCRARPDWMSADRAILLDYKSTAGSAEPNAWIRNQMAPLGYDMQAVHYLRGNQATGGSDHAQWIFLVQENYEPYACSFVGLSPAMRELAQMKWDAAFATWRACLQKNRWPGYPVQIAYAEPSSWQIDAEEERRLTVEERLDFALA